MKTEFWNGYKIRFVEKEIGEWWAVAADVADALGYRMASDMTRILEDQDKGTQKVSTLGGDQEMLIISEFGIYDAVFSSHKPEAKQFKRWVFGVIKALRKASGLEGFQVFRTLDKEHQKAAMRTLSQNLAKPVRVNFIKVNTITNKAISVRHGLSEMLKKADMSPQMLVERQPILDDTVTLETMNARFGLGISVSKTIYAKYGPPS